jgi:hypothetical protein
MLPDLVPTFRIKVGHKKAQKGTKTENVLLCILCLFVAYLKICGAEGVALAHVSGFVTSLEPTQTLLGGAVCE